MKKNLVLSSSAFAMQFVRIIISLFAAIHVLIFVGSFTNDFPINQNINELKALVFSNPGGLKIHELSNENQWLSYTVILQNVITLSLLFAILGHGINIIRNIQHEKTFSKSNILAFDKVSQLAVILFVIQFLKLGPDKIGIGFEFSYLFLAFGAIILNQVFKEGHRLLEDNELTV